MGSLYLAIIEDVFKTNEGDRDAEIKKLEAEYKKQTDFMDLATEKLITGDLDKVGYQRMKTNNVKKCADITSGSLPIIASGGINSVAAAKLKLAAGATLVQVYSGLIYHGPKLARDLISNI